MFCPNCGASIEEGASFCPTCGSRIVASQQNNAQQDPFGAQSSNSATINQASWNNTPVQTAPVQTAPAAKPKKSNAMLIVGIIVSILAIAAIVFFVFFYDKVFGKDKDDKDKKKDSKTTEASLNPGYDIDDDFSQNTVDLDDYGNYDDYYDDDFNSNDDDSSIGDNSGSNAVASGRYVCDMGGGSYMALTITGNKVTLDAYNASVDANLSYTGTITFSGNTFVISYDDASLGNDTGTYDSASETISSAGYTFVK